MKIQNLAKLMALVMVLFSILRPAAAQQTGTAAGVPVQMVVSVEPRHGHEVPMITSGIDTVYLGVEMNPYVDASIKDAQCAGVVVYSIYTPSAGHFGHSYWRTYWGQNYLAQIAEETGGESYYFMGPQAPVSFAPYLDMLNHQLSNQFLLTFLAKPQKKAEKERVKITSEIHSVDLVYPEMVCVPSSPE